MNGRCRLNPVKLRMIVFVGFLLLFHQNLSLCFSLSEEGFALMRFRERIEKDPFGALSNWNGSNHPCSWFGVECSSDGKVVCLHLKDLCLQGTLAPELLKLASLKSIVLRNNSFYGNVPKEIGELKELEVLDLGYNNFSGPFPVDYADTLSLNTIFLDNNEFLGSISSPELYDLKVLSEIQMDENHLRPSCSSRDSTWNMAQSGNIAHQMRLQVVNTANPPTAHKHDVHRTISRSSPSASLLPPLFGPSESPSSQFLSPSNPIFLSPSSSISPSKSPSGAPSYSPSESPLSSSLPPSPSPTEAPPQASPAPADPSTAVFSQPQIHVVPKIPVLSPSQAAGDHKFKSKHQIVLIAGIVGCSLFLLISAAGAFFCRSSKVVTVKPWATGLSGQLQKAFITGVPKLKRSELEVACEDFSNIIGCFPNGTVFKGTLSSGVEIAVTSTAVTSRKEWLKNLEANLRKKIDALSKMNHKNFVNLIGYCEEDEPFTRMMVFEYAPNGTLFEHLHIKEAEHLDWGMRLRIAMGIACCLDYMHQLTPPIYHDNLQSSTIFLTEDYAAKISDFSLWNNITASKMELMSKELVNPSSADQASNIYGFGAVLYELITGKIFNAQDRDSLCAWMSDYLRGQKVTREMVDPTLNTFKEDELEKLISVVNNCTDPDVKQRPAMNEVVAKLKEITAMGPDGATPKLSPLWWAELEIMSAEGS